VERAVGGAVEPCLQAGAALAGTRSLFRGPTSRSFAAQIGGRTGDAEQAVTRAEFEWRHAIDRA
jgi:hypothetical protein